MSDASRVGLSSVLRLDAFSSPGHAWQTLGSPPHPRRRERGADTRGGLRTVPAIPAAAPEACDALRPWRHFRGSGSAGSSCPRGSEVTVCDRHSFVRNVFWLFCGTWSLVRGFAESKGWRRWGPGEGRRRCRPVSCGRMASQARGPCHTCSEQVGRGPWCFGVGC